MECREGLSGVRRVVNLFKPQPAENAFREVNHNELIVYDEDRSRIVDLHSLTSRRARFDLGKAAAKQPLASSQKQELV
jgi:hypothetical protein